MLTLDDLQSDWLQPEREEDFALPAIANLHGMVQAAWDVAGVRNWIVPPTGLATPTAWLYELRGPRPRRLDGPVRFRWKAYEIEREADGVRTVTRLAPHGGLVQRIEFARAGRFQLAVGGLARTWQFTDYWNLVPEDVPDLGVVWDGERVVLTDVKTFGRAAFDLPGSVRVFRDITAWLEGRAPVDRGGVAIAEFDARAGDVVTWMAGQGAEERLELPDARGSWERARSEWETTWQDAFTPGNTSFGGHLPYLRGPLERLYAMSVLTLLLCRRTIPAPTARSSIATGGQCIWNFGGASPLEHAYVWGGPEGAPTTLFLWELEFQAPLLARLDPVVLRNLLEAMLRVDLGRHWGVETLTGRGAGMAYGVNPGAILSCFSDYVRVTGDRAFALRHVAELRGFARPGLTDCGTFENVLECVPSYEHTVAALNALNAKGLRFLGELTGDSAMTRAGDRLARDVVGLYADGPFACVQPDGSRRIVRTVLDFTYVGLSITDDLPAEVKRGMAEFFERELQTRDWLCALSPHDPDALTPVLPRVQRYRADHQATGSYDGWPARAATVLWRFGEREKVLRWLTAIQELTREGPFGQAHFVHADGARKASFFNGNCYFESAGCGFATMLLDEVGHA